MRVPILAGDFYSTGEKENHEELGVLKPGGAATPPPNNTEMCMCVQVCVSLCVPTCLRGTLCASLHVWLSLWEGVPVSTQNEGGGTISFPTLPSLMRVKKNSKIIALRPGPTLPLQNPPFSSPCH